MKEIWKDITGFEGLYQISNLARIKSLPKKIGARNKGETFLKYKFNPAGYPIVGLCKDSKYKWFLVHRLTAIYFIPNPNNYPQINHKDGNPLNILLDNLEWCNQKHNMWHSYYVLNKKHFINRPIRQLDLFGKLVRIFPGVQNASKVLNKNVSGIHAALNRKSKKGYGFKWEYI